MLAPARPVVRVLVRRRQRVRAVSALGERVESDALQQSVRERTIKAIESLGGTTTVGDASARTGLTLSETDTALKALATDTGAVLTVSEAGDIVYRYSGGLRARLAAKSWRTRAAPALAKVASTAEWLARVSFGATLLASLLIVFTAVTLVLQGKSDDRNDRRSSSVSYRFGPSLFDFYFWDTTAVRRRQQERNLNQRESMGFLESVRTRL